MRSILLVNPLSGPVALQSKRPLGSLALKLLPVEGILPLGLATVAALTPNDVDVDIWDEAVHGVISPDTHFPKDYALVGVTGYINHAARVRALGRIFRRRGILTVVGGSGVSSEPELFREDFDVRFIGEAEYTWPQFMADWGAGTFQAEYRQVSKVDLANSPPPRLDKLSLKSYFMGALQTTRGCPFDCEFCDVIYLFGRQARHKSIEQVLEEVRALKRHGYRHVIICDDNFIGNPQYAKALLLALQRLNGSFKDPIAFYTNVTLNVAKNDELLGLLVAANFPGVFIGIESPNIDSLIEANKPQNYRVDIAAAVKKVQSHGIFVQCGMIVGFDHDDATIFDRHFEFLQETGLTIPMINLLKAPTGTPLWARLLKEGRVIRLPEAMEAANTDALTNIIPKRMTLEELLTGYLRLVERVRDWDNFEARVKTMLAQIERRPSARPRRSWIAALTYLLLVSVVGAAARRVALRLLLHTWQQAPGMIDSVMGLVALQYMQASQVPGLRAALLERIRRLPESGVDGELEMPVFLVPEAFRKAYKAVFPQLYERVQMGLADKSRTQAALIRVTSDFLTRWGPSFTSLGEHHRVFLNELCDRTIAAENGQPQTIYAGEPSDLAGIRAETRPPADARAPRGLADDVLHAVEQALRSLQPA